MTTQPEALRLAEWIEGDMSCQGDAEIAAELRRLHAVNQELLEALRAIINDGLHCDVVPHLHEKARAAIARAEGERT
jgi:hypothetical protein